MAQAGTTFEKKYVYHGQLCQISPFVGQVTGYKKFHEKEPVTFFFKVQGDAEGEYGVKMEDGCPGYEEVWKHVCHEHREQWVTIACEGMAKDGKGVVAISSLDGEVLATNSDAQEAQPVAQKAQGSAPAPARATNGGKQAFPYASQAERFSEALRVAGALIESDDFPTLKTNQEKAEFTQRLAVSMTISQEHIHRSTGAWVPLETQEADERERQATKDEVEALRILFGDVVLEVPSRERKALEDLLARAPKITYGAVCKAADYLGVLRQQRMEAEPQDDSPSQDPPAEGEPELPF